MEIILGQFKNRPIKLIEINPGEFTFSGFIKIGWIMIEESEIEKEYNYIQMEGSPRLISGQQITDKLRIKSIIFDDGRYKILTENIDDGRIDNDKSQDTDVSNGEQVGDKDVLQE